MEFVYSFYIFGRQPFLMPKIFDIIGDKNFGGCTITIFIMLPCIAIFSQSCSAQGTKLSCNDILRVGKNRFDFGRRH